MLDDRIRRPPVITLDTPVLVGVGLAVVVLCVVSFLVGRWSVGEPERIAAEPEPVEVGSIEKDLSFLEQVEADRRATPSPPAPEAQESVAVPSPPKIDEPPASEEPKAPRPVTPKPKTEPGPTTPPPAASQEPAASLAPDSSGYMIQVFASEQLERARELRDSLARKGYPAKIESTVVRGRTYHRVRVGPYAQKSRADRTARRLQTEEKLNTWIVRP